MTLKDKLIQGLIEAGITSPRLEADIILKHTAPQYPNISENEEKNAEIMLKRRMAHEPLDKIIGKREFYKSSFTVSRAVLSPRPDTEVLVESALELLPLDKELKILDMGTGSGCILLSLLKERPQAMGVGLDISKEALQIAQENAENLGLNGRVEFICQSWTDSHLFLPSFDMVVSNPPYIPSVEIATLDKEVKEYDPLSALDGGADGLKCYKDIAKILPDLLKSDAYALFEVGYNQADDVMEIYKKAGLKPHKIVKDLAGIKRCVILKK